MSIGEARRIFDNIDSQQYTDEQKGEAILRVLKMEQGERRKVWKYKENKNDK